MTEEEYVRMTGFDTTRLWATQAQVWSNGPFSVIVFREQMNVSTDDPADEERTLSKNLTSIVMPTPVAQQLGALIRNVLGEPPQVEESAAGGEGS